MRMGKFALVGLIGLFVNEFMLFVFTDIFHIYYLISSVLGVELAIISNFTLHELWTFADRRKKSNTFTRFLLYNAFSFSGMALNVALLFVFTEIFGIYYLLSNIFAVFIVCIHLSSTRRTRKPTPLRNKSCSEVS